MLQSQFYIRLMLIIAVGVLYVKAYMNMAQRNSKETEPKRHILLKIFGGFWAVMGIIMSIMGCYFITQITFPLEAIGPYISPNMIVRSTDQTMYWGYATMSQSQCLSMITSAFECFALSAYCFLYKSSSSKWYTKIGKVLFCILFYMFYASATDFHFFDIYEWTAPVLFSIMAFFALRNKNAKQTEKVQDMDTCESGETTITPEVSNDIEQTGSNESTETKYAALHKDITQEASNADLSTEIPHLSNHDEVSPAIESAVKYCRHCEKKIDYADGRFCKHCGKSFLYNMKYCRYCWKLIDIDSSFCTHCGKNQDIQGDSTYIGSIRKAFAKYKEIIISFIQSFLVKQKTSYINYNSKTWENIKNWGKRTFILILVLAVVGAIVLLGFWLYGFHITSKWEKEDEHRVSIAMNDISQADSIARKLFEEYANDSHRYYFSRCKFDHIERGIEIIRNAAEQGDAKAQFTLGCIYGGYDCGHKVWRTGRITMMGEYVDNERAAYWYNQAAIQGNTSAMNNLANLYREGKGVKKDLFKATELMESAAEKGCALAQRNYGDMFRDGEVMLKIESDSVGGDSIIIHANPNISKAQEWWQKALENGETSAKERLERIYE